VSKRYSFDYSGHAMGPDAATRRYERSIAHVGCAEWCSKLTPCHTAPERGIVSPARPTAPERGIVSPARPTAPERGIVSPARPTPSDVQCAFKF
jgi:hypothetical protein